MAATTVICGHLFVPWSVRSADDKARLYKLTCAGIADLPGYERDTWPYLPREVFHCIASEPAISVDFRGYVISFGLAIKEINRYAGEWTDWLDKFEALLARTWWTRAAVQLWAPGYAAGMLGIEPAAAQGSSGFHQWQYIWEADEEACAALLLDPPAPVRTWRRFDPEPRI